MYAPRRPPAPGGPFTDGWQLARARSMATRNYLTEHGVDPERIRLTQEGALEPDTLFTGDSKRSFRAPVLRYSHWTNMLIKASNPVPQSGGPEDEDPR